LPAAHATLVAEDPEAAAEVARFVVCELEILGQLHRSSDALFVARVVRSLPATPRTGRKPWGRTGILAGFYALGGAAACWVAWGSNLAESWLEALHGGLEAVSVATAASSGSTTVVGVVAGVVMVVAAIVVASAGPHTHTA
jgi:hypothetical protein